jgi:hypothetical protein
MAVLNNSKSSSKPVPVLVFYQAGDLKIRCRQPSGKIVALLIVCVHDLMKYANPRLLKILQDNATPKHEVLDIQDDKLMGLELCMGIIHKSNNFHGFLLPVRAIWCGLQSCSQWFKSIDLLKDWFHAWYQLQDVEAFSHDDRTVLAMPLRYFNRCHGFAEITRRLAFEAAGKTTFYNPELYGKQMRHEPRLQGMRPSSPAGG